MVTNESQRGLLFDDVSPFSLQRDHLRMTSLLVRVVSPVLNRAAFTSDSLAPATLVRKLKLWAVGADC
jgi:hypothetical protein